MPAGRPCAIRSAIKSCLQTAEDGLIERSELPTDGLQWRKMDVLQREREYSPSSVIGGDYQSFIDAYVESSDQARARCDRTLTLAYGQLPGNTIDLALPAQAGCPLLVFIHGGYWQELSKRESFFGADRFTTEGIAYAAIDYTLAPAATVSQIVAQCRRGIECLIAKAEIYGVNPERIFLAGSSAGAHLAAMCAWHERSYSIAGVILLSGIYELEPLIGTTINNALGLTVDEARRHSPLLLPIDSPTPAIISWGQFETAEFKRQSQQMAGRLVSAGANVKLFETAGRNHFDLVHDLPQGSSLLGRHTLNLIKTGNGNA